MLKAGLIGFGGITGAHLNGYKKLFEEKKVQLVCAYDIEPEAFKRKSQINISAGDNSNSEDIRTYTDLDEMLDNVIEEKIENEREKLLEYAHSKKL